MKSSRRGFIGRLLAAVAAPVLPITAIAQAEHGVSRLAAIGADFDGNVDLGPVGRGMTRPVFVYDEDVRHYYPSSMFGFNDNESFTP